MPKKNPLIPYNPKLKAYARELRKNMTIPELSLWQRIRRKATGVEFHRQVPLDEFIVDFYCHEIRLAIEVDGSSHDEKMQQDQKRQERLEFLGVRCIRFTNWQIQHQTDSVMLALEERVRELKEEHQEEDE